MSAAPPTPPDQPFLAQLPGVAFKPILIMGDHRTGTTLLYQLLTATRQFNYVSAYHVIQYGELLHHHFNHTEAQARQDLAKTLKDLAIADRAIDAVIPTPDLPEEYGFILKQAGYEPYLTLETRPLFLELCQKIQLVSVPERPLLLKNPWDFRQFLEVKRAIPGAKWIFMHRHPIHTLNSKLKALRSLLHTQNSYMALLLPWYREFHQSWWQQAFYRTLYSRILQLDFRQIARQAVKTNAYFVENISTLSSDEYVAVRYEDLCRSPETTLAQILNFLGLPPQIPVIVPDQIQPRPLKLLPEVQQRYEQLCHQLQPYMKYHGYIP